MYVCMFVGAATPKDLSPKDFFIFPAGCNRIVPELRRSGSNVCAFLH